MNSKMKRIAAQNELDETVFVRWRDAEEVGTVEAFASHEREQLLDRAENSAVVGVYKLVAIEKIERNTGVVTTVIAQ